MGNAPRALALGLLIGSWLFPGDFEDASGLYREGRVHEAYEKVSTFLNKKPRNWEGRVLLFKIYLDKNLLVKSQEVLTGLLKEREDEETWMLSARQFLAMGKETQSRDQILKVLDRNRRHITALVILAQIEERAGYPSRSTQLYREAGLIQEDHPEYLAAYGQFLLNQKKYGELDMILARFQKAQPESPAFFHLAAKRAMVDKDWNKAMALTQKALFWRKEDPALLDTLKEIYAQSGRTREFIQYMEKHPGPDGAPSDPFELAYAHYLAGKKGPFLLPDPKFNQINFFPAIDNAITRDENNEVIRAFAEEVVLHSTGLTDPLREKYAAFHRARVKWFSENGDRDKALLEWLRLVTLVPQNLDDRLGYGAFLKDQGFVSSYLEQLKLVRNFSILSKFEIEAKILINERRLANSLERRHQIDPLGVTFFKHRIVFAQPLRVNGYQTRNLQEVYSQMIFDRMTQIHAIKATRQDARSLDQILTRDPQDFVLSVTAEEGVGRLKTDVVLTDGVTRIPVYRQTFVTDGKEKFLTTLSLLGKWLASVLPPKGTILKNDPEALVVSIGLRDGLSKNHSVELYSGLKPQGSPLASGKPIQIDEFFTKLEVDKADALRFLKAGDLALAKATSNR